MTYKNYWVGNAWEFLLKVQIVGFLCVMGFVGASKYINNQCGYSNISCM